MKKATLSLLLLLLLSVNSAWPIVISGRIIDSNSGSPISNANVFISQTTISTRSNKDGYFQLNVNLTGYFTLAVTRIGYESFTTSLKNEGKDIHFDVQLTSKEYALGEIKVYPHFWKKKYYDIFRKTFIGTSENADFCEIENPKSINFYGSKDGHIKAFSDSDIIIRNKALGYIVYYKMDKFELYYYKQKQINKEDTGSEEITINSKTDLSELVSQQQSKTSYQIYEKEAKYSGELHFEDIIDDTQSKNERKKILRNRSKAYFGSAMHFFRCLYIDSLQENGYSVLKIKKVKNKIVPIAPIKWQSYFTDSNQTIKSFNMQMPVLIIYGKAGEPDRFYAFPKISEGLRSIRGKQLSVIDFKDVTSYSLGGNAIGYQKIRGHFFWQRIADKLPYDFSSPSELP